MQGPIKSEKLYGRESQRRCWQFKCEMLNLGSIQMQLYSLTVEWQLVAESQESSVFVYERQRERQQRLTENMFIFDQLHTPGP